MSSAAARTAEHPAADTGTPPAHGPAREHAHQHGAHPHHHAPARHLRRAKAPAAPQVGASILRLSLASRLAIVAGLVVPLWAAVLMVVG